MFEADSADTCAKRFPLVSMGGRVEGLACADPGARTPHGASRILFTLIIIDINNLAGHPPVLAKQCYTLSSTLITCPVKSSTTKTINICNVQFIPSKKYSHCFCIIEKFRRLWGSSLQGLRTLDPLLSPPSTPAVIFWRELKPHAKFQNPMITPSGRKVSDGAKKEKEKKKKRL